jgi:hypothetical protein
MPLVRSERTARELCAPTKKQVLSVPELTDLPLSSDKDIPIIDIGPIKGARDLYNKLKKAELEADRRRGVVHIEK